MKGLPSSRPASPTAVLPSIYTPLSTKTARSPLYRWVLGGVAIFCLIRLHPAGVTGLARIGLDELEGLTCEERGLMSRAANSSEEASRVAIVVRASTLSGEPPNVDNTVLDSSFHPFLTSSHPILFPGTDIADYDPAPNPLPGSPSSACIQPIQHAVQMLAPPPPAVKDPQLFFSFATSPSRVVEFAPIWNHFLGPPAPAKAPPGCVVVDAQGQGDVEGRRLANAALVESGTGCIMKESSRVGERYEMRVLGLVKDAWVESERRRWQDNGPIVQWYLFNDDDTFWIDIKDLKETLLQYDPSEDHMLGGFSEAKDNFADHGKIAFGGAGIILSRSLVRKMQGLVGTCARKFQHIFGGDGILTNCAALARDMAYQDVVEEIPGLSQMDLRGDASGFLTSGQKLLSLHHWVGWLDLLPNTTGVDAVALFADGADAIGGRNMFRRWVFDGGRTVWTAGFSVMIHRDALTTADLAKVEHSWIGFEPRKPSRDARVEGVDKLSYFITAVEHLSPTLTLFRHECTHPSVQNDLRRIDILWDSKGETSWWDIANRGRRFKGPPRHQRTVENAARKKVAAAKASASIAAAKLLSTSSAAYYPTLANVGAIQTPSPSPTVPVALDSVVAESTVVESAVVESEASKALIAKQEAAMSKAVAYLASVSAAAAVPSGTETPIAPIALLAQQAKPKGKPRPKSKGKGRGKKAPKKPAAAAAAAEQRP